MKKARGIVLGITQRNASSNFKTCNGWKKIPFMEDTFKSSIPCDRKTLTTIFNSKIPWRFSQSGWLVRIGNTKKMRKMFTICGDYNFTQFFARNLPVVVKIS